MSKLTDDEIRKKIDSVPYWHQQIEIRPGITTPGEQSRKWVLDALNAPDDCRGLRVLDIGTRDGFFAFEFEKRGADVIAVDYLSPDKLGFKVAHEILGSKVEFRVENIYNIRKEKYGTFDIVLFLGLIYHLRDPLYSLDIVRSICKNEMYLETHAIDNAFVDEDGKLVPISKISKRLEDFPIMQFFPKNSFIGDYSYYWAPNFKCMELMLEEANFVVIEKKLLRTSAIFKCKIGNDEGMEYYKNIGRGIINPQNP